MIKAAFNDERWAEIRRKGKYRFIYDYGMLYFGLLTSVCSILVINLLDGVFLEKAVSDLLFVILFTTIGGVIWGIGMWRWMEYYYHRKG
ncbi:hypothetical protein EV207_10498 [Scopulibacillus darangshiensis]|uniref:Uncharacterized protein n=1 Tax=Scopulibacillus darangshiensis TaxID=442528 RepID=A0A4R2P7J9_9BACL|nr:hypothetical protein [Scopulibacillus darangshiensis]TCP30919.1 hypothetical protein EV207_10498 [Scopulibacillus darangshiensis]